MTIVLLDGVAATVDGDVEGRHDGTSEHDGTPFRHLHHVQPPFFSNFAP